MVKKAPPKAKPLRETPLQIRLTTEEKQTFTEAATNAHQSLSEWLRQAGWHAVRTQHKLS